MILADEQETAAPCIDCGELLVLPARLASMADLRCHGCLRDHDSKGTTADRIRAAMKRLQGGV